MRSSGGETIDSLTKLLWARTGPSGRVGGTNAMLRRIALERRTGTVGRRWARSSVERHEGVSGAVIVVLALLLVLRPQWLTWHGPPVARRRTRAEGVRGAALACRARPRERPQAVRRDASRAPRSGSSPAPAVESAEI